MSTRSSAPVTYVAETSPGIPDAQVLSLARGATAVLLTGDKDFGELVHRQRLVHSVVVLATLAGYTPQAKAEIMTSAIEAHGREFEFGFAVVTGTAVRIRRPKFD